MGQGEEGNEETTKGKAWEGPPGLGVPCDHPILHYQAVRGEGGLGQSVCWMCSKVAYLYIWILLGDLRLEPHQPGPALQLGGRHVLRHLQPGGGGEAQAG